LQKYIQAAIDWFQKLTDEQKRRFAIICTAVFSFLLFLAVLLSFTGGGKNKEKHEETGDLLIKAPIPAGELFIPEEPDFIPGVLLGRERRSAWTEEDAGVFWQDPLKQGEEIWREKIEAAVEDILERVP